MRKQLLAFTLILGMGTAALQGAAEARGADYTAKDELGRVRCNLYFNDVAGQKPIVEVMYTDRDDTGAKYLVTATGYMMPEALIIRHGTKEYASDTVEKDFHDLSYPIKLLPEGYQIGPNKSDKDGKAFFTSIYGENPLAGKYNYHGDIVPYTSAFAARMLVESLGIEHTNLDSFYYYSKDNPYIYEYTVIPDLKEAYPETNCDSIGRRMHVSVISESGMRSTVNTFIISNDLENVWRLEQDGSLFQIYGLDGVG